MANNNLLLLVINVIIRSSGIARSIVVLYIELVERVTFYCRFWPEVGESQGRSRLGAMGRSRNRDEILIFLCTSSHHCCCSICLQLLCRVFSLLDLKESFGSTSKPSPISVSAD